MLRFKDCNGLEEITTMSMDALGKRLITASRAGDVMVCVPLRNTICSGLAKNIETRLCVLKTNLYSTLCHAQVWNYMNGECLKHMQTPGNVEVTGLVHLLERSQFLVTGWNRRITSFPDEPDVRLTHTSAIRLDF